MFALFDGQLFSPVSALPFVAIFFIFYGFATSSITIAGVGVRRLLWYVHICLRFLMRVCMLHAKRSFIRFALWRCVSFCFLLFSQRDGFSPWRYWSAAIGGFCSHQDRCLCQIVSYVCFRDLASTCRILTFAFFCRRVVDWRFCTRRREAFLCCSPVRTTCSSWTR